MSKFTRPLNIILTCFIALTFLLTISCAGPAIDYQPSGLTSLLAFSSDRYNTVHIYTIKPDGTDLFSTSNDNMTLDGSPWWSPDGSRIVFNSTFSDDFEIWSMNADGTDRRQLTNRIGMDTVPRYSPDGTKVVFVGEFKGEYTAHGHEHEHEHAEEEEGLGMGHTHAHLMPAYEIMIVNADGSNMRRITDHNISGSIWNSVPTWSPDGSKILFGTGREGDGITPVLYTMNLDGSNQQRFGFPFLIEGTMPDWSPVTNKIVFVRGSAAKGDIWVMDAGSPFPGLTAKKLTDNYDNNRNPVWSPDGKQIAFVSDIYGNDDIFIMNADGSDVRRLTYDEATERHPTWR
ncbi:MAG: PD40 domain-containing protein [Dehalococcoidia bacterium]|nr:PD40 domain-containing protein [Dehalococcoidia bacterium]